MHISKLNKFWHQLSSFITTLWDGVNYKFMQLVDLRNSSGCIPGYQAKKVYTQGQLKLTHINFVILNSYVKVIYLRFIKNTLRRLKKENVETNSSWIFFFSKSVKNEKLLPAEKFGNIKLHQQTVKLRIWNFQGYWRNSKWIFQEVN